MYANFTLGLALSNNYARQYTISFELYSHKVTLSIEIFSRFIYITRGWDFYSIAHNTSIRM